MRQYLSVMLFSIVITITSGTASALTLKNAIIDACMTKTCDNTCLSKEASLKKALTQCQKAGAMIRISCDEFVLKTSAKSVDILEGNDPVDNRLQCAYDESVEGSDIYLCETAQGNPYGKVKIEASMKKGSQSEMILKVDFQDTTFAVPGGWHALECQGGLKLH